MNSSYRMINSRSISLQTTRKLVSSIMVLLTMLLCAGLSSVNSDSLMNGTQSGKSIAFLWGMGIISVLAVIRFCFDPARTRIKLNIIDGLLTVLILYILLRNNFSELVHSLLFLELMGLAILYIVISQLNFQNHLWILIALIAGGTIQAIYGNLQLWGYYPSHHGLFKMTGSFFNPGPYSGYLAAVFPIALGLYFQKLKIEKLDCLIVRMFDHFKPSNISNPSNLLSNFFQTLQTRSLKLFKLSVKPFKREASNPSNILNILNSESLIHITAIATIVSILLVLPASRSRAAWLAVLVSSVYLLSVKYQLYDRLKAYFDTYTKKIFLLVGFVVLLTITGAGLYHLKKGSADGRILIWKVSAEMIKDKPLFGHGYDGFKSHYMDYQAAYFKSNPDSEDALVAGDNMYAFNEFLQQATEGGLIGLILILLVVFTVFSNPSNIFQSFQTRSDQTIHPSADGSNPSNAKPQTFHPSADGSNAKPQTLLLHISRAVILSILVFSLFSYPLQILPIKICLVVVLAIAAGALSRKVKANLHLPKLNKPILFAFKSIFSVGCLLAFWLTIGQIQQIQTAYTNWKNAFDLYNIGVYDDCLSDYKKAYPILKTNGDFLTNDGKALTMAEKHTEAIVVLQQAAKYYPNTVVYTALGDSYKNLKQTELAEKVYLHAWYMNPSRFYPKYLLAKLYDETGQKEKAIEVANELLGKDIKIGSTAIKEIQEEMKKILIK
jgi:O-antigen polymerase